ncbi:MAG TPA: YhdP family protein [Steroidobacteraceae bacterium]|jgi:uncharacterized protein (TIGR02099 family)
MLLFRRFAKYFLITLAVLVVVCGLLLGAFQLAVARVPEYRVQLQDWVSDRVGLVIEFRKLSARLRVYGPELVFNDAIVRTPDRTRVLATARRGSVGFDVWTCLTSGRLTAGRFSLDAPQIGLIRTRDGRIQLVGQSALPDREAKPVAVDQLPIGVFRVRNAVVSFRDEATGRGPWSLSGVDFILDRGTELLGLTGTASLPPALGKGLQFSGRAVGRLETPESLLTTFNLKGEQLDLGGWADVLPDEWPVPDTGHGSMSFGISMHGFDLTGVTAKVDVAHVTAVAPAWSVELPKAQPLVIRADDDDSAAADTLKRAPVKAAEAVAAAAAASASELLSYQRIAFDMNASRVADRWQASAVNVDLNRDGSPWHAARLEAQWSRNEAGALDLSGKADRVVLQNLWPLLAYLPESEGMARLRAMRANGEIADLNLSAQGKSAADPQTYSVQARINALSFKPVLGAPGFSGLTGQLRATQDGGEAQLDSSGVQFDLPHVFREPLQARSVRGSFDWQHGQDGWRIGGKDIHLVSDDGSAAATLAMQFPADGSSPILQMTAQAQDLNAASTARYLPANKLSEKTLDWLDHAFVSGRVQQADMTFNGPLRAFPFRNGEGEFLVRGRVTGMTFAYQSGWTPATDLAADVEFRNEGMRVRSATATVGGLRVVEASGEFADFKAGEIGIKATAAGDLGPALRYLQTSPISAALGTQFARLHGQGETHSAVSLWLPLKRIADRRIVVTTQLKDATVRLGDLDAPITHLSGSLRVKQSLPDAATLQGQLLGGPVNVSIKADDPASHAATLTANGQAAADRLAPLLHLPAPASVSGSTQWQLQTRFEQPPTAAPDSDKGQARRFVIDADMNGFGISLPHPVGKREDERRPLHVEINYDGAEEILTQAALGNVRGVIRLQQTKGDWALDRGLVRADGRTPRLPRNHGLRLAGSVDHLVLDDWLALRGDSAAGSSHLADFLHSASLRVGTLQLYGYQWLDVHGELRPQEAGWGVEVSGPNASGRLFIPNDFSGSKPLTATMERLVVTGVEGATGGGEPSDPRSWPSVRAYVGELHVDNHAIGAVDLRASRVATGIRIDALTLVNEGVQGNAHGEWLVTPTGQQSNLTAKVTSTDVGATLRAMSYPQFMEAKHGELSAVLTWPGGFNRKLLDNASGSVIVDAENGQLVTLQPGAGRVLGLFSVAALPRRLSLDFSDLTEKGLGFDTVHGNFELRNGNAYTNNLLLRGPAAEIGIAGRVGLGVHDYDQTAVVTGNLGATLPVAGVLAGGPAIGAALLLFSQVFKEPLKGITRAYYRITGNWEDPVVERVESAEVKSGAAAASASGR